VAPESERFAARALEELGLATRPLIGVNISAGSAARDWGVGNFRTLLAGVARDHPSMALLLLYRPSDRARAEAIAAGIDGVSISPVTHSFDHFAALIRKLRLLVTPDTSAVHLAAAFGVPAAVLYVQSDPDLCVWEPYATRCAIHVTDVDDLTTILPDAVIASVARLLRGEPPEDGR
jgi:ADP-heptose:LPS heptosyltransferase